MDAMLILAVFALYFLPAIVGWNKKGQSKVWCVVDGGNITNYNLMIEDAIAVCEAVPCNDHSSTPVSDKHDDLRKLKDLFDQAILTQEEYDKEKAKLPSNN